MPERVQHLSDTATTTTNGVAVAAVTSPWWLDYLYTTSEIAALLAPIAGVVWLTLQAVLAIKRYRRGQ